MRPQSVIDVWAPAQPLPPPSSKTPEPGAYDLVTFNELLDELDIKPAEMANPRTVRWLARAITDVSARISKYCGSVSEVGGRVFQIEGLSELIYLDQDPYPYQTPGGVNPLQLSRWPLVNLTPLTATAVAQTGGEVLTFAAVPASVAEGQPVSHANVAPGTTVAAVASPNVTLSAPLVLPVDIGDTVLFGMSVSQTLASGELVSLGPLVDYNWVDYDGSLLRLNAFTGVVTFWEALPVTVSYYAGYAAIPADLAGAALEWLVMRWASRGRDPMLRSESEPGSLGSRSWWVGGPPSSGSVPDAIRGVLDGYREIVIA